MGTVKMRVKCLKHVPDCGSQLNNVTCVRQAVSSDIFLGNGKTVVGSMGP